MNGLSRQVWVFLATCAVSLGASAKLSPPTVDPPLLSCATTVSISGFVPGATIEIFVGGSNRIGGGVSDSPWGQVFKVTPALSTGEVVTARQSFRGETSDPSPAVTVLSPRKKYGGKLPTPAMQSPLYACGGALAVTGLAKGGLLSVYADGTGIGQVDGCGEGQWLRVSPLLGLGQKVAADEKLCAISSPMSAAVTVEPTPATLPPVEVGEIYEGGKYCVIEGITNGALVTTLNGTTVVDKGHYPGGGQIVRLTPPPAAGDIITASQALCATSSPPSVGVEVQPCSNLPPPTLAPICPGHQKVGIAKSALGSRIQVYADGVLVADGGGSSVNLFAPATAGQTYTAVQSLGSCVSKPSSPLAVGCIPPKQIPVGIRPGGRAVAIAVHPEDSRKLTVASETGGLFGSTDQGQHWSHVSGATTFVFTDVSYVPGSAKMIVATADRDTRVESGGGLWRSIDGGSTWKRPSVAYPTGACRRDAAAFALEYEKESARLWAASSCGVAYSDNSGASWTYLAPGTGYNRDRTLAVVAPDKTRLVILTASGVKVSTDGGSTFTQSTTGLPTQIAIGVHNQIAVPAANKDHIYWAFNYWELVDPATNDWKGHIALYRSTDFGSTWSRVIDKDGINRPPFVRLAESLAREAGKYDIYFGDGSCSLQRATADAGAGAGVSAWTALNFDHCDPADLAFDNDNRTPLLLATDGGLHLTKDSGANWALAGSGPYGYNALQITEVTGQFKRRTADVDLYFATQDNNIWASPDTGATWPADRCCEGFFLNIPRAYYPAVLTRLTGVSCGGCGNFMSERLLANQQGWPNPPNDSGNPRLLKPGHYIQNTADPANPGSTFALTTDTGANWSSRYFFSEAVRDLSQISGPTDDPVVYTPKKSAGTTPDNQEVVQLKRIGGVLGSGTPVVSDVTGVKGMGIFPTMFAWYKVFGVHPGDPNYLMVPDTVDRVVKVSTDAGGSWTTDALLTSGATQGDEFKFYWAPFTQVSTIGVNPDCRGHILVGTQQAGIQVTYNNGVTWGRVAGTEVIPFVSRFFFKGGSEVIVSSYGRGLWKLGYTCPTRYRPWPLVKFTLFEPFLFWKGAKVPLAQVTPQGACERCTYILSKGGNVTDIALDPATGDVRSVSIDRGSLAAYKAGAKEVAVPVRWKAVPRGSLFANQPDMPGQLSGAAHVKGLFLEGRKLRGVIIAADDLKPAQVPDSRPGGPRIELALKDHAGRIEINSGPIPIRGHGFDRRHALEVLVDGKPIEIGRAITWSPEGTFTLWLPPSLGLGGHAVVVRQRTDAGLVEDATTFLITVSDRDKEEKEPRRPR